MDNPQPPGNSIQALYEANEYLRAIFDSIRDYAVFTLDLHGRVASWNTGAERVFGWTEAEIVGQSGHLIFTPEDRENYAPEKEMHGALEKGVAEDIRWHLRKDGTRFFASGTMRQLRDHEGELRGFIKVTRDTTADLLRQQAEAALVQSEEKYRTLFSSIDTGFCIIKVLFDENGKGVDYRFLEVNPAFEQQTGLTNAVGKNIRDLVPLHEEYWFEIYGKVALTGEPIRFENAAKQLHRYYDVYAFRIGLPEDHHVAVLFNDIADRKRREENSAFLAEVNQDFSFADTIEQALEVVGAKIYRYFELTRLSIAYFEEESNRLTIIYDQHEPGLPGVLGENTLSDFLDTAFLDGFRAGQVFAVNDTQTDPRTADSAELFDTLGVRSHLLAPFIQEGRWRFGISLNKNHAYEWRADQIELLQSLAPRIYLSLERARAEDEAREQRILAERLHERQKFARDLHDAVSQTLFGAGIMTETLPRIAEQTPEQLPGLLLELNRLIRGAQAEMRTLLLELRPANLESTPLSRLLRQLVDTVQGRRRMTITLNVEDEPVLPPEVHVAVYRIAQEALSNIFKHAKADEAWVNGRGGEGVVELRIRDGGTGFDPENPNAGLGLQMMCERAADIDAMLEINSAPGTGTDVHLIYPRTETSRL